MIYGPDDKPIPRPVTPLERWYSRRALEILRNRLRFSDLWGPRLYAAVWQSDNHFRNAGAGIGNIHGGHVGDISSRR